MDTKQRSGPADIVSQDLEKQLPRGTVLLFSHLDANTTAEMVSEFLAACGLQVEPERISIRNYNDGASAKVSFEIAEVAMLVNWAINGRTLNLREMVAHHSFRRQ